MKLLAPLRKNPQKMHEVRIVDAISTVGASSRKGLTHPTASADEGSPTGWKPVVQKKGRLENLPYARALMKLLAPLGKNPGEMHESFGCGLVFLCEGLLHRRLHLFGGHVLEVRRERPFVAERIGHDAVAVAPEHVGGRHDYGRAGLLGPLDRRVAVLDIVRCRDCTPGAE